MTAEAASWPALEPIPACPANPSTARVPPAGCLVRSEDPLPVHRHSDSHGRRRHHPQWAATPTIEAMTRWPLQDPCPGPPPPDRRPVHNSQPVCDCGLNRQVDLVRFHKRPACEISLKHRHRMPVLRDTHNGIGAPAQFQPMTNTVLCTLTRGERTRKHHDSTRSMPLLAGPCPSLNNGNAKHTEDFRRSEPRTQPCAGLSRPGERHRPPPLPLLPVSTSHLGPEAPSHLARSVPVPDPGNHCAGHLDARQGTGGTMRSSGLVRDPTMPGEQWRASRW